MNCYSPNSLYDTGYLIYVATNQNDRLKYVGCTTSSLKDRINQHYHKAESDNIKKSRFHSALPNGKFKFEPITRVYSKETAEAAERFFIWKFNSKWHGYYNERSPRTRMNNYKVDEDPNFKLGPFIVKDEELVIENSTLKIRKIVRKN